MLFRYSPLTSLSVLHHSSLSLQNQNRIQKYHQTYRLKNEEQNEEEQQIDNDNQGTWVNIGTIETNI